MGNCNAPRKHQQLNDTSGELDNEHTKQYQLFLNRIPHDFYCYRYRFYLGEKRTNLFFETVYMGKLTRINVGYNNADSVLENATLSDHQITVSLDKCLIVIRFVKQKDPNSQYPDAMMSFGGGKFERYSIKIE